ncbi:MAG: hypothetical protein WEF51_04480, partial [Chloroflexota bacterium]
MPIVISSLYIGAWTAAAIWFAITCLWVPLKRAGAGRLAFAVVAVATLAVPLSALVATLLRVSPLIAVVLATIALVALQFTVPRLVSLSRGSRPPEPPPPVMAAIVEASRRYEVGDIAGLVTGLKEAEGLRTPTASRYLDLWQRFAEEEVRRRAGEPVSSRETIEALQREGNSLFEDRFRPRRSAVALAALIAAVVAAVPPYAVASLRPDWFHPACRDASAILERAERTPVNTTPGSEALADLVVVAPGVTATLLTGATMDLDVAGRSRHDPEARDKLAAAGFVGAYVRVWRTADGREINAEIFDFESQEGATIFHRQMTDHACPFANGAFPGQLNGVGLQVRYGSGDPIVEQIAWVDGSRRILVSRSFTQTPADHASILDL